MRSGYIDRYRSGDQRSRSISYDVCRVGWDENECIVSWRRRKGSSFI